jgi:acyl carrier protein
MESNLREQIAEIAYSILGFGVDTINEKDVNNERKLLHLIISDSNKALQLVTLIEDEFNIEFDDEDVDLEFFQSFDSILERLKKYI